MTEQIMVVGSLNRTVPYFADATGVGLTVYRFDDENGHVSFICQETSVDNAGFLSVHPSNGAIYVNTEMGGWHEGLVSAYRYDPTSCRLRYLNKHATLGSTAAYNSVDRNGTQLLLANYGMEAVGEGPDRAAVVFPILSDGSLGPAISSLRHQGTGPNQERQERAHPHCIRQSPDGAFVLVADLGLDAIITYPIDADGILGEESGRTQLPPGAGPRHFIFHPSGDLLILLSELDSMVTSFRYRPAEGSLERLDSQSLLPAGFAGTNHGADLQLHADGRTIYASNRGHDSIAIIDLDPETGVLQCLTHHGSGGRTPRNLALDPSGRFLIVANQDSSCLSVFRIAGTRHERLLPVADIPVGTPMCVRFLPTADQGPGV